MYLDVEQVAQLTRLLATFFTLPYSTDLDGKDAETLIRLVKGSNEARSKRKELFDIVDGNIGYSVKTLFKSPRALRVDLQEQRFCDVQEVRSMIASGNSDNAAHGKILLSYMRGRMQEHMEARGITVAKSLILLKFWNASRTKFQFRYWEEDFLGYIDELWDRNDRDEIEWVMLPGGIHARDRLRQDTSGKNIRLLRMHHKHNQIFTDHDIPEDAIAMSFEASPLSWWQLVNLLDTPTT